MDNFARRAFSIVENIRHQALIPWQGLNKRIKNLSSIYLFEFQYISPKIFSFLELPPFIFWINYWKLTTSDINPKNQKSHEKFDD
jgi:hypothetical protein